MIGLCSLLWAYEPVADLSQDSANVDVIQSSLSVRDGGGYCRLHETGVSRDIRYEGELILARSRSGGSYCCGFTFQVAMDVATERGLLQGKSYPQVKRFQKQWYGSEPGSEARQAALAMETLGIGREVSLERATAGDFVVFYRGRFGHSVVLLDTIRRDGKIIGLYYRSSQPGTNGVGNVTEYFTDTGYTNGTILRESIVVARLNER
jgi:hypothetical protein